MKLAQALNLRKSQNNMLNNLISQIAQNAFNGDYEPNELINSYIRLAKKQEKLINCINKTNTVTVINDLSLAELRIKRDMLIEMTDKLSGLPKSKKSVSYRDRDAVPEENRIDLVRLNIVTDDFARQAREIDDIIQSTNWTVDLIDFE